MNKNKTVLLSSLVVVVLFLAIIVNQEKVFSLIKNSAQILGLVKSSQTETPILIDFPYKFETVKTLSGENRFDIPITNFNETEARKSLGKIGEDYDFGNIRDFWGYPEKDNFYKTFKPSEEKSDENPNIPGRVNCRANTNMTGYFEAYFEEVALDLNVGYDHPTYGQIRRDKACQVLQDIAELVGLDATNTTPDIIFEKNPGNIPSNALAAASAYTRYNTFFNDNGSLHKHIISRQDPTPSAGSFDAFVITNFNGIPWDDVSLNSNTYHLYTVLYHEIIHTMGFRSLLGAEVSQTNVEKKHTTLDKYAYRDDTLANPFFNSLSEVFQVPVGAPPSWFINNSVVYQGVKNILNATPDGIRPVYSPLAWEQGSSLSHFDMSRSSGQIYLMNPSISKNTIRSIHTHEKEVLCHLGYKVVGLSGCESSIPVAIDDSFILNTQSFVCINPLANDNSFSNGLLSINTLHPVTLQSGDILQYYPFENCIGIAQAGAGGAKSLKITFGPSSNPRLIKYTNKGLISNRISSPAKISFVKCDTGENEYVCNGDFEIPVSTYQSAFDCGTSWLPLGGNTPFWCQMSGSPDLASQNLNSSFQHLALPFNCSTTNFPNCILNTPDNSKNMAHLYSFVFPEDLIREGITTKLKDALTVGENYLLSFDVFVIGSTGNIPKIRAGLNINPAVTFSSYYSPIIDQEVVFQDITPNTNQWVHIEKIFTADDTHNFLSLHNYSNLPASANYIYRFYVDNVSIKKVNNIEEIGVNTIKGTVYVDSNTNGSMGSNESKLEGVSVGLFKQGQSNPVQVKNTQGIPSLGKYTFSNVPAGFYYVVLMNESLYSSVTQPVLNSSVLAGYNHPYSINVIEGQNFSNKNFGVVLSNTGGKIKIIKDVEPGYSSQDFTFGRSFGPNFFLDDDINSSLSNAITFDVPNNATYQVNEIIPSGALYAVENILCTDPSGDTTVDLSTNQANIKITNYETVICKFINVSKKDQ